MRPLKALGLVCLLIFSVSSPAFSQGSEGEFLFEGKHIVDARVDLIRNAQGKIIINTFAWSQDAASFTIIREVLLRLKRNPIPVEITLDPKPILRHGGIEMFHVLAEAGADVRFINFKADPGIQAPKFMAASGLMHDKILADMKTMLIGGTNYGESYIDATKYVDFDVLVRDLKVLKELHEYHDRRFKEADPNWREKKPGERARIDAMRERIMKEGVYEGSEFHKRLIEANKNGKVKHTAIESMEFVNNDRSMGKYKTNIDAFMDVVNKTPRGGKVVLMSPFVFVTPKIMKAFREARARNVDITIITNGPGEKAVPYKVDAFNFWSKAKLNKLGITVAFYEGGRRVHSKYAVNNVGDAYIGSHILNPNSQNLNSEAGVRIKSYGMSSMLMDFSQVLIADSVMMGKTSLIDFVPCNTINSISSGIVNAMRNIPKSIGRMYGGQRSP